MCANLTTIRERHHRATRSASEADRNFVGACLAGRYGELAKDAAAGVLTEVESFALDYGSTDVADRVIDAANSAEIEALTS